MKQPLPIAVGLKVRLRKLHPCGSDLWTVTRVGADIGIVCAKCSRRVMLDREEFERRVRLVVETPLPSEAPPMMGE